MLMEITFIAKINDIGVRVFIGIKVKVNVANKTDNIRQVFEKDIC